MYPPKNQLGLKPSGIKFIPMPTIIFNLFSAVTACRDWKADPIKYLGLSPYVIKKGIVGRI